MNTIFFFVEVLLLKIMVKTKKMYTPPSCSAAVRQLRHNKFTNLFIPIDLVHFGRFLIIICIKIWKIYEVERLIVTNCYLL